MQKLLLVKAIPLLAASTALAQAPEEARTTDSGLAYKVLEPGEGDERPGEDDNVEVYYTDWTTDGTMLDSIGDARATRDRPVGAGLRRVARRLATHAQG